MYPLRKLLVAVDGSELDSSLINFAKYITETSVTDTIYFVNVLRHLHIPPEVEKEFPNMLENAINDRKLQLEKSVKKTLGDIPVKVEYVVEHGQPGKRLLAMTEKYNIDLIIAGRKSELKGSNVLVQRLTRRATCSLLIVPEKSAPYPLRILVPIDFSKYAQNALEQAIIMASRTKDEVEILCQNVYNVPAGYHYTGKTFEEFQDIMKNHASRNFEQFISEINLLDQKVNAEYTLDKDEDPVADIYEKAINAKVDLIAIGAKGRTASTALFIGSMAERLIQMNDTIPMLVIRPKGKAAGWIDVLKEI